MTEIGVAGSQVRISPLTLPDSLQVRLKRLYPSATYRPTTSTVAVPIPKSGGVGSAPLRDDELVDYITTLLDQVTRKV